MEKSRKTILNIYTTAPVFMGRDPVEVQLMCWLRLAEIPQHHKKIEVQASELNKKKALDSLFKEGLIGHRAKVYRLTQRGNEMVDSWLKYQNNE